MNSKSQPCRLGLDATDYMFFKYVTVISVLSVAEIALKERTAHVTFHNNI